MSFLTLANPHFIRKRVHCLDKSPHICKDNQFFHIIYKVTPVTCLLNVQTTTLLFKLERIPKRLCLAFTIIVRKERCDGIHIAENSGNEKEEAILKRSKQY